MFWRNKRKQNSQRSRTRFLKVEPLESRQMLSGAGIVNINIFPVAAPGDLALVGDADNNSVKITSGANVGEYIITGVDNTLLQVNSSGLTMHQVTVNGIVGNMRVDLDMGTNQFDFEGPASGRSAVPGDLSILDHPGDNTAIIHDTTINGNLSISKTAGASGFQNLQLARVTVIGDTIVDNQTGGGSGGSSTLIDTCQLQGGGGTSLSLTNGYGYDTLTVTSSEFGSGFFPGAIVTIDNGDGASLVQFKGTASAQTRIDGGLNIANGSNLPLTFDEVDFIYTEVMGAVNVTDAAGDTQTNVQYSRLGTSLTTSSPVTILNNVGKDQFNMIGTSQAPSEAQWGLLINNDSSAAGASNWGSDVTITDNCKIGTFPLGPAVPLAPDGLIIRGDRGIDKVTIGGTSTQIGGFLHMDLFAGNNKVSLTTTSMAGLELVTGAGNDDVSVVGCTIPVLVSVDLGAGADRMKIKKTSVLPDLLYGALTINGGTGVDTFFADAYPDVKPALGLQPGFEVWSDWT